VVTVLPDVVLSVVPVVVLTGEVVLPDVVDAGVVVEPVGRQLESSIVIDFMSLFAMQMSLLRLAF